MSTLAQRSRRPARWAFHLKLAIACAALFSGVAIAAVTEAKEVRVGMGLPKPPYILESGTAGLDVEIAKAALIAGGYKLVGVMLPQARALAMLQSGQLDGLLSITIDIGGHDHFTVDYVTYQNVATTLTSRKLEIRQVEDLAKYSVAAFQNASVVLGKRFKDVAGVHKSYNEYSVQSTQGKLLFAGRVDVVVGDHLIFRHYSDRLAPEFDARQAVTHHRIFPESPRKAVFRDAQVRDGFNAGLKIIRANGTYDAIMAQYLGAKQH